MIVSNMDEIEKIKDTIEIYLTGDELISLLHGKTIIDKIPYPNIKITLERIP